MKQKRSLINLIREFFTSENFFELETPLLVPSPGMEVHLHGFKTNYLNFHGEVIEYYLPTSPEFAIKKALGSGFDKVFEIARVFRNHGESGPLHHPEFNMLEWYRPGSYLEIMDDVDRLLEFLQSRFPEIQKPSGFSWELESKRTSIQECFEKYGQIDLERGMEDSKYWRNESINILNETIPENESFEDIFFRVWMKIIEPNLGMTQAEIIYDYPASMAALSKLKEPEHKWSERFELYIQGVEIGNAFSELTDSLEQERRFKSANAERLALGYPPHPIDYDLIEAVGKMQATGGIAIGIERLLMVLCQETDISQFYLQPLGEIRRI
ncbi:MAG: EF-P lysine aminoacylase GenX [Candidatus Marinimicrobia bacterium]|nr:EF-P lysine aminoacylase GenX [Candidatus Neomarinimicrobiota bacterium]